MLRTLQRRATPLSNSVQRSLLSTTAPTAAGPSSKTTALITRLPATATLDVLKNALKDVKNTRKLEIQPGCALHYLKQQEANAAAQFLNSAKYTATVGPATVPSIVITNIPASVSSEQLLNEFKEFRPLSANVSDASGTAKPTENVLTTLRFRPSPKIPSAQSVFENIKKEHTLLSVTEGVRAKTPALVLRNIKHLKEEQALSLLTSFSPLDTKVVRKSEDGFLQEAVATFATEQEAMAAVRALKDTTLDGVRISTTYKELDSYAVLVRNLPSGVKKSDIMSPIVGVCTATIKTSIFGSGDDSYAVMTTEEKGNADIVASVFKGLTLGGKTLEATVVDYSPIEYRVVTDKSVPASVWESKLDVKGLKLLSATESTDMKSVLNFHTIDDARMAQNALHTKKIGEALGQQSCTKLSVSPSFVVDVNGLAENQSVAQLLKDMEKKNVNASAFKTDRNAVLKFKKHRDLVPGLNVIRKIEIDDQKIRGERYIPLVKDFQSAYDQSEHGHYEAMDKASLKMLWKDSLGSDPATRYQLAANAFEIALQDARAHNDPTVLIDTDQMPPAVIEEVSSLLNKSSTEARNRLFDLYVQSLGESKNFKEMESLLGAVDESDPLNWSQYRIENNDDLHKQYKHVQKLGKIAEMEQLRAMYGNFHDEGVDENLAASEDGTLDGAVGKQQDRDAFDEKAYLKQLDDDDDEDSDDDEEFEESAVTLTDEEGRLWAGYILNQDMVQKTMPGQRIGTHRALVVIGNMRGAAGYGMGKGQTTADAVNSAFRAAVRNVVHIDLYENFGLAEDLYGKHNSCHAYIRATPRSRTMVASNFASAVLEMFGIGSASVKMIGRRDPYSQVRALFNAISKHQNIDEYARTRGKRYLTLQAARDEGI